MLFHVGGVSVRHHRAWEIPCVVVGDELCGVSQNSGVCCVSDAHTVESKCLLAPKSKLCLGFRKEYCAMKSETKIPIANPRCNGISTLSATCNSVCMLTV